MKRHPGLEPFSRDHNDGLILARKLATKGAAALTEFREVWTVELADHFQEEERLLGPLCGDEGVSRLIREHREIEQLGNSASNDDEAHRLGELLNSHIRWEERELFPEIETASSEAALQSLEAASQPLEKRRWKIDPNRAKLVARRATPNPLPMADLAYLCEISQSRGPQWGAESEDMNVTLLAWSEGQGIEEHVNDEVDVLIVGLEGEMRLQIDGTEHRLRAGQVVIVPKGASRSLIATTARAAHVNVHRRKRKMMPTFGSSRP